MSMHAFAANSARIRASLNITFLFGFSVLYWSLDDLTQLTSIALIAAKVLRNLKIMVC